MAGTITVSAQTISQAGILRLCNPRDGITPSLIAKPGVDVWLCPNGTIARLVTANVDPSNALSPNNPLPAINSAKQIQWKSDVLRWLQNFGLNVGAADEEPWVEVEVWEPFFARLAGEAWRQSDENPSMLPLKRMLWPARFCFRRASSSKSSSRVQTSLLDEPLDFAEQWSTVTGSLNLDAAVNLQNTPIAQEPQPRDLEMSPSPKVEPTEHIESLSRIAQYPDLQSANLVYPTPPDGAVPVGPSAPSTSEAMADGPDFGISRGHQQSSRRNFEDTDSPLIQNNATGVGTGRYDASDEEDLFGEISGRDFGSKGIADADFSFFDDPDFEGMGGDEQSEEFEQAHQPSPGQSYVDPDAMADEVQSPNLLPEPTITQEEHLSPAHEKPSESPDQIKLRDELTQSPIDRAPQTISPPLSPIEVKKILFPGTQVAGHTQPTDHRGQGHYLPVTFEHRLGNWDQKYGAAGKFWFSTDNPLEDGVQSSTIPTIGLPRRTRGSANGSITKDRSAVGTSVAKIEQDLRSTSVSSDESDDSDDSVEMLSEPAPTPKTIPTIPSLKRKRAPSDSDLLSIASPAKSMAGNDTNPPSATENSIFLGNFLANFSDWTFTGYFSAFTPQQHPVLLRREHQLQVAQLLVDQITQSSLKHSLDGHIGLFDLESQCSSLQPLEDIRLPGDASKLDLKKYISLQDELFASQSQQPQSQAQPPHKDFPKSLIYKLPAPHVRIRRGKEFLEALPPTVSFWETFGLEPAHGAKDISAYCIHPQIASKAADAFLTRFGLLYKSCNLGNHTRGEFSMAFEDGLRPWQSESPRYESMMQVLKGMCEELGMQNHPVFQHQLTVV